MDTISVISEADIKRQPENAKTPTDSFRLVHTRMQSKDTKYSALQVETIIVDIIPIFTTTTTTL